MATIVCNLINWVPVVPLTDAKYGATSSSSSSAGMAFRSSVEAREEMKEKKERGC